MSHEQHNPNDQFAAWGKAAQKLPARNLELKNVALFSLKPLQLKQKPRLRWWQYVMGAVTATGVLCVVGLAVLNETRMATSSGSLALLDKSVSVPMDAEQDLYNAQEYNVGAESLVMIQPANRFEKSIADTREFLKTYYQATIRTRQVAKLSMHIQTMARGYDGRVDDISVNKKTAHISFVVPKNKFDAFTEELRSLVKPKFIEEIISSENLLPEKQQVEKQTDAAEEILDDMQKQRQELLDNHAMEVKNLQQKIIVYSRQISSLRAQYNATTSTERQQILSNQIAYTTRQQNQAKQELVQENQRFDVALKANDADLATSHKRIEYLEEQDQGLLANVETVEASVSLRWISVWEIIDLYVSIGWIAGGLLLAAWIGYFTLIRRKKLTVPV